jgi:sugar phosphate isomerase/epimerase
MTIPAVTTVDLVGRSGLAVQLYTVRNEIEKDLHGTLAKLREIGFRYVETAFWPEGVSLEQASEALRKADLKVCSSHIELPAADGKRKMLETAAAFKTKFVIWHGWPEDKRYQTIEGTKDLISLYNASAVMAEENSLHFGIHNHWWELRNQMEGKPVYKWLLQQMDPRIFWEADAYWIKVAGFDPAKVIREMGRRAKFIHMKDGPARWHPSLADDNPDPMTAVGKGTQDVAAISKACQAHVDWMVVEMDKVEGDVFEALRQSHRYLIDGGYVRS